MREHFEKHLAIDNAYCKAESEAAVLVTIEGEDFWIPKSQLHDDSEVYRKGDSGTLIITKWIAKQKGIWEDD